MLDFVLRRQRYEKKMKNANNWRENLQMSKKMCKFAAGLVDKDIFLVNNDQQQSTTELIFFRSTIKDN